MNLREENIIQLRRVEHFCTEMLEEKRTEPQDGGEVPEKLLDASQVQRLMRETCRSVELSGKWKSPSSISSAFGSSSSSFVFAQEDEEK